MNRSTLSSSALAGRFRQWVRQDPVRFRKYSRLREAMHAFKWAPYRARKSLPRKIRKAWTAIYWLPYRCFPRVWQGTAYASFAQAGFPPAPIPKFVRHGVAAVRALLRPDRSRVGSFTPVRHADASHLATHWVELVPAQVLEYAAPKVFGAPPAGWPAPWTPVRVAMGPITAAEWSAATVFGKFDTVLVDQHCIVGDLWQRETERTFDEVRGYARIRGDQITYYQKRKATPMTLDEAIVIVGGPTGNWAHWITEYLPKLALAEDLERYRGWPLVVDEGLHPNIMASLELVAAPRTVVRLPQGVPMRVNRAVTIGSPGHTAYEYRYDPDTGPPGFKREHTVFSPVALDLVRQRAWQAVGARPARQRLIYITRPKGSLRPFVGASAVEGFFAALGFELLDCGAMSAREQVSLFAQARCIAGQSGAGLTNLVFAPPGCRVVVFQANSPHSIFHYFANMGAAAGHHVYYAYGEAIYEPGGHPGHAGFSLELQDVKRLWEAVLADEPELAP